MPSRAELGARVERVLRAVAIAALAMLLWQSLRPPRAEGGGELGARGVGVGALAKWSEMSKAPRAIHIRLDSVPSRVERAWLAALAGVGSNITWSGDLRPVMVQAQPIAIPKGGTLVSVAAPNGSPALISDDIGPVDSVRIANSGATVRLGAGTDRVAARVNRSAASALLVDSLALRKVLVIGGAGWESKFVIAALEEEGWKVDALIRLAPGVEVSGPSAPAIDTGRYSAVIAIDSTAAAYANQIVEYARTGGGVILEPQAASLDAMSGLRSGTVTRATPGTAAEASLTVSRSTLPFAPIQSPRPDAIPLERRSGVVAVAARRVAAGRAVQIGYEDTWRWRMSGGDTGVDNHRKWWSYLVSTVAYAPRMSRVSNPGALVGSPWLTTDDPAPFTELVAAVGPPASIASISRPRTSFDSTAWLFAVLCVALLAEVLSRRMRGAT